MSFSASSSSLMRGYAGIGRGRQPVGQGAALLVHADDDGAQRRPLQPHQVRRRAPQRPVGGQLRHRREPQPVDDDRRLEQRHLPGGKAHRQQQAGDPQPAEQGAGDDASRRQPQLPPSGKRQREHDDRRDHPCRAEVVLEEPHQEPQRQHRHQRLEHRLQRLQQPVLPQHRHPGDRRHVRRRDGHHRVGFTHRRSGGSVWPPPGRGWSRRAW